MPKLEKSVERFGLAVANYAEAKARGAIELEVGRTDADIASIRAELESLNMRMQKLTATVARLMATETDSVKVDL